MLRETSRHCRRIALLAGVLGALSACDGGSDPRAPERGVSAGDSPLPVELVSARRGAIAAGWQGTATLMARDDAGVSARVGGEVAEVLVDVGDRVARGEALARLDTERLKLDADRAEAIFQQRRAESARSERLLERNLVAADAHERTVSEMRTARAEYELAALTLREATISAPFDGVIAERHVTRGNAISAGELLFRIIAVDTLEATLSVPEREIGRLRVGQPAELRVDALPGQAFSAQVARIAPAVAADSGTVAVTLRVDDTDPPLRVGMFVRARVIHDRREDALLVPVDAVQREDGADEVFVAQEDGEGMLRARRTVVTTGYREGGLVEVRDGLQDEARVVTAGRAGLRDGARLRDINAAANDR